MSTYPSIHKKTIKITVGCPRCLWWCCVVCGVWVHEGVVLCVVCCVVCGCFYFSFFLSSLLFSSLLFASLLFLFPSPQQTLCKSTDQQNVTSNFEAFACDLAHGRCTAVGFSPLLLSTPSSLLSPSSSKKERETFYYRNISGEEFIFLLQFLN